MMHKTLLIPFWLLVIAVLISACVAPDKRMTATAVITSPVDNMEVPVGDIVQIQGQVDGQNINRVDVLIDATTRTLLAGPDKNATVLTFPVRLTWTTEYASWHVVQLNAYDLNGRLIGQSRAVTFWTRKQSATVNLKSSPQLSPNLAPVPATPTPTTSPITPTATRASPTATATAMLKPILPVVTRAPPTVTATATVKSITLTVAAIRPTATVTPTPIVIVTQNNINIRSGPGLTFTVVGQLSLSETAPLLSRSADGQWLQIAFVKGVGGRGWVRSDLVQVSTTTANALVIPETPRPTSTLIPTTTLR
jgi:uncharacterized protein YraI